jgi:hypothetical protein
MSSEAPKDNNNAATAARVTAAGTIAQNQPPKKGSVTFPKNASVQSDISRNSNWSSIKRNPALKVVVSTKANMGIPSRGSVKIHRKENHHEESLIYKLHHFFSSHTCHLALNALLMIDVLIIFAELFIMAEYPKCHIIERSCKACCSIGGGGDYDADYPDDADADGVERWLAGGGGGTCKDGYDEIGEAICKETPAGWVYTKETLFWITISILLIFLFEAFVEMATLGKLYWKQVFLVLDFAVVSISLALELFFHFAASGLDLEEIVALLILIRLWRFVRIGHGVVEVASEITSTAYEPLFHYIAKLEKDLAVHGHALPEKPHKVRELIEGHNADHTNPHKEVFETAF